MYDCFDDIKISIEIRRIGFWSSILEKNLRRKEIIKKIENKNLKKIKLLNSLFGVEKNMISHFTKNLK